MMGFFLKHKRKNIELQIIFIEAGLLDYRKRGRYRRLKETNTIERRTKDVRRKSEMVQ
jgi:hypothetical protein